MAFPSESEFGYGPFLTNPNLVMVYLGDHIDFLLLQSQELNTEVTKGAVN